MLQTFEYREAHRAADLAICRKLLCGGSRSFYAASLLLPKRIRDPATALYAFCRLADDAIDTAASGNDAVEELRTRLQAAYAGRPYDIPADRALADVVARFAIPRALPEALVDGFAWDKAGRTYETMTDLLDYAARVAGTVGAMMSLLMGRRAEETIARACDLGMAMQLTNISRDVGEDARNGRLYLPRQWMREAGIDPETWLAAPRFSPEIASVISKVLGVADQLYAQGDAGIRQLPADCRPGITAARLLYAEIGREVERRRCNSIDSRGVVSSRRKLALLGHSIRSVPAAIVPGELTSRGASRFLIDAAVMMPGNPHAGHTLAWWDVRGRMHFVIDLFERLERRERSNSAGPRTARSIEALQA